MKTTATIKELRKALLKTNKKHGYKLGFERIEQFTKNKVLFTLKSPSKIKGARVSHSGRNLPKASWHAHGNFFDMLFEINPNAIVTTGQKKITINEGNWQDIQIGSIMFPKLMSSTSIGE